MKHTPGPWRVRAASVNERDMWAIEAPAENQLNNMVATGLFNKANAHLIAVAPEMLEALEDVLALMSEMDITINPRQFDTYQKVKAAIAKAKVDE